MDGRPLAKRSKRAVDPSGEKAPAYLGIKGQRYEKVNWHMFFRRHRSIGGLYGNHVEEREPEKYKHKYRLRRQFQRLDPGGHRYTG